MTDVLLGDDVDRVDDLVVRACAHVRIRNLSGTIVLAVGADAVQLSDIAEFIWRAMAPGRRVHEIVTMVAAAHGAAEPEVRDDVVDFLTDLHARGFVAFGPLYGGGAG